MICSEERCFAKFYYYGRGDKHLKEKVYIGSLDEVEKMIKGCYGSSAEIIEIREVEEPE